MFDELPQLNFLFMLLVYIVKNLLHCVRLVLSGVRDFAYRFIEFWFCHVQKISKLLDQIAQLNEVLVARHRVLASKLAN